MSHSEEPILRTSPARFGKMLAILLGIMVVGGVIFFMNYDYWNSYVPAAGKIHGETSEQQGKVTGQTVEFNVSFIESPDFKTYAFNALSGSDHNPEYHAHVGDKIIFHVKNGGKSFHAFGVTASKEGPGPILDGTAVGTPDNPLKPGKTGDATFVASQPGEYYYICTVPGHRELGMEGKIEIEAAGTGTPAPAVEVKPTGNKVEFTLSFVMSSDFKTYAFNALSGPDSNPTIKVKSGDTVTIHIKNDSKSFHSFGVVENPDNPADVLWNSAVATPDNPLKPGKSGDVTFVAGAPGTYHYICTVPGHAALGMDGHFVVE
jgi:nitrite reductase (NO-forming)